MYGVARFQLSFLSQEYTSFILLSLCYKGLIYLKIP